MRGHDVIGSTDREYVDTARAIAAAGGAPTVSIQNGQVVTSSNNSGLLPGQRPTGQPVGNLPIKIGAWDVRTTGLLPGTTGGRPLPSSTAGAGAAAAATTVSPTGQPQPGLSPEAETYLTPWEQAQLAGAVKNPAEFLMMKNEQFNWFSQQATQRAPGNMALKSVSETADKGVHWLTNLFDTEDEADWVGESVFDGALKTLGWASDTLQWGATGAFLAANPHYWANRDTFGVARDKNGEIIRDRQGNPMYTGTTGNLWQDATNVAAGEALQALASPVQDFLGELVAWEFGGDEQQGVYTIWAEDRGEKFNIANPQHRDAMYRNPDMDTNLGDAISRFTDNPVGKMLAGPMGPVAEHLTQDVDIAPSMFAAGLGGAVTVGGMEEILTFGAGKFLKFGRVRYLDGLIDSPETAQKVIQTVKNDKVILDNNRSIIGTTEDGLPLADEIEDIPIEHVDSLSVSPVTRFLHASVARTYDETGEARKVVDYRTIYNHRAIRWAANRGALAKAFHNARTFDEAELIWRHAIGDESAQMELSRIRPELLEGILNGERNLIETMLSANPSKVAAEAAKWEKRHDILLKRIDDMKESGVDERIIAEFRNEADKVAAAWRDAANAKVPRVGAGANATPEEVDLMRRAIDKQLEGDDLFIRSLETARNEASSLYGSMRESVAGLGGVTGGKSVFGDTPLGLHMNMLEARDVANIGRSVHKSRMRRAAAKAQSQKGWGANFKGLNWKVDEFYGIYGHPIARVFYWMGNERPSGLIRTAGVGAQESEREIMALLDSIDIYSGDAKMVTRPTRVKRMNENGKPVLDENGDVVWDWEDVQRPVGGVARKEALIEEYVNALLRGGPEGQFDAKKMLDDLQEQLVNDIADWNGIDRKTLSEIHYRQNKMLEKVKKDIEQDGYWYEDGVKHYAPFLESQIQNQSFLKNWRKIAQKAEHMARQEKGGIVGRADNLFEYSADAVNRLNEGFQTFWRPSVLLRPGYTVRNVIEGTARAMSFEFSLMPAVDAVKQIGLSLGNTGGRITGRTRRAYAMVEDAKKFRDFDKMPKKFQKWHAQQQLALADELHRASRMVDLQVDTLAAESEAFRLARIDQQTQKAFALIDQRDALKAAGADQGELDAVAARIKDIEEEITSLKAMKGGDGEIDEFHQRVIDNIDWMESVELPFLEGTQRVLLDPVGSAQLYRKQATMTRRLYSKQKDVADYDSLASVMRGMALEEPFAPSSTFAQIALSNLSADHAQRLTAGLRQQAMTDLLKVIENRYYVPVKRGEPTYFDGIATVINQYQNSELGAIIIRGRAEGWDDATIVTEASRWLYSQRANPAWDENWFEEFISSVNRNTFGGQSLGEFEGVRARNVRGAAAADRAVEPIDVEIKALKADRAALRRNIRAAEKDFEARQAASSRELKTYVVDGKRKTRAQMDKMLEDADRRLFEATERRQSVWDETAAVDPKDKGRYGVGEMEDMAEFTAELLRRYDIVTGRNPEFQRYLFADEQLPMGNAKGQTDAGRIVQSFLDQRDADGHHMWELPPTVIGTETIAVGTASWSQPIQTASQAGFKWLGTIPEDTFVRAPFYGRRFNKTAKVMYDQIVSQVGEEGVTLRHVNMIREAAHRRALKDTKDWLYTVERRTNLGDTMENIIPFVSATQNTVTTLGRLVWKDPSILAFWKAAWQAPDMLLRDEDGNPDSIAVPITMLHSIPGVSNALEWAGLDDKLHWNKNQLDLWLQGIFDPQMQGLIRLPVSEAVKNGWFGDATTTEAPSWAVKLFDGNDDLANYMWEGFMRAALGTNDETREPMPPSSRWMSYDALLAPAQRQTLEGIFTEGSVSFANNLAKIEAAEMAKWQAGLRDEPTFEELSTKARAITLARVAVLMSPMVSPPQQVGEYDALTSAIKAVDSAYAQDQKRIEAEKAAALARGEEWTTEREAASRLVAPAEEMFGETLVWAFSGRTRDTTSGLPAIKDAQDFAVGTEPFIRDVAPRLEQTGNLPLLGMFISNPDRVYDPAVSSWMLENRIPGTTENYSERLDPAGIRAEQRRSSGWTAYMRGAETIMSLMNDAGFTSRNQAGAEQFDQAFHDLVDTLKADARYGMDWYSDFDDPEGAKAQEAMRVITDGFNNEAFNEHFKDDPTWGIGGSAYSYMTARQQIVDGLEYLEQMRDAQGIRSWEDADAVQLKTAREELLAQWNGDPARGMIGIKNSFDLSDPDWVTVRLRYIGDDETPRDIGMRFGG